MLLDCLDSERAKVKTIRKRKGSDSHHKHRTSVVPWQLVLLLELIAQPVSLLLRRLYPHGVRQDGYLGCY